MMDVYRCTPGAATPCLGVFASAVGWIHAQALCPEPRQAGQPDHKPPLA